jgi:hypothetical protein
MKRNVIVEVDECTSSLYVKSHQDVYIHLDSTHQGHAKSLRLRAQRDRCGAGNLERSSKLEVS